MVTDLNRALSAPHDDVPPLFNLFSLQGIFFKPSLLSSNPQLYLHGISKLRRFI
jgi:hypothetical protein